MNRLIQRAATWAQACAARVWWWSVKREYGMGDFPESWALTELRSHAGLFPPIPPGDIEDYLRMLRDNSPNR